MMTNLLHLIQNLLLRLNHKINSSNRFLFLQILLLFVSMNYFVSALQCRLDVSSSQRYSLTKSSVNFLKNIEETIYINAYYSSKIPAENKARILMVQEMLKQIQSINPDKIKLRFYDPDESEDLVQQAYNDGIQPQRFEKIDVGSAQVKNAFLGIALHHEKQHEVIPTAFYIEEIEVQIVSSIRKLIRKKLQLSSNLAVLIDPGLSLPIPPGSQSGKDTYGIFIHKLFSEEFGSAQEISANLKAIPENIQILIAVGLPEWTEIGKFHIDQFLMRGGKFILLPKTMDFKMNPDENYNGLAIGMNGLAQTIQGITELNDFLSHYGVSVGSDLVFNASMGLPMGSVLETEQGFVGKSFYPLCLVLSKDSQNFSTSNNLTKDLEYLLLPWAHSLSYNKDKQPNANYEVIMQTSSKSSLLTDYVFVGEKQIANLNPKMSSDKIPLALDIKGNFTSYFKIQKQDSKIEAKDLIESTILGKESELIVISSPYLISDLLVLPEFRELYQAANVPFMINAYEILNGNQELVEARYKKSLFEPLQPFTGSEQILYNIIHIILLPMCIILFAFFRMKSRNSGMTLE
ncbi:MAG: GldG family protein [Leptospiraceae bacterium]|nr:GldG family protein [Leptospiraceae bacterium]